MNGADISVATWNINQWPWPGTFSGARRRLAEVEKRLVDYDVVCLQECWSAAARDLRLTAPYHFLDGARSAVGFGSGLVTVSRHAVVAGSCRRFQARRFPDSLAAKGMTLTRVSIHGFGDVDIVNTHLQAWRGAGVRERQFGELGEFVAGAGECDLTILAGDLNSPSSVAGLSRLCRELGFVDLLKTVRPACADEAGRGKVRFTGDDSRVDHLLLATRPGVEVKVLETGTVPGPAGAPYPSDHHGLYARLFVHRPAREECK